MHVYMSYLGKFTVYGLHDITTWLADRVWRAQRSTCMKIGNI